MIPFSYNSQYDSWIKTNCDCCAKSCAVGESCEIEDALEDAYHGLGRVAPNIAAQLQRIEDEQTIEQCKNWKPSKPWIREWQTFPMVKELHD